MKVGQEFRLHRIAMGKTQDEFGGLLFGKGGSSRRQMVSDLETGNRNLTLAELEKLCSHVGLTVFMNFASAGDVVGMSRNMEKYLDRIVETNKIKREDSK